MSRYEKKIKVAKEEMEAAKKAKEKREAIKAMRVKKDK